MFPLTFNDLVFLTVASYDLEISTLQEVIAKKRLFIFILFILDILLCTSRCDGQTT